MTASMTGSRVHEHPRPLTQSQAVDVVLARRLGWLLLDAVLATTQPSAGNDGIQQDRSIR
jgi:hypothetical protein